MAIITKKEIIPTDVIRKVTSRESGAVVTFFGTVRGKSTGKRVVCLEYEAHITMAEKALREIEDEARRRWKVKKVFMIHRIGRVGVGEISVGIAVSAPHRDEAFRACRHCIDKIKAVVPLWKKEVYPDGEKWIRGKEHSGINGKKF